MSPDMRLVIFILIAFLMSPNRGQVLDLVNPFHLLPPLHLATLNQITVSSTCDPENCELDAVRLQTVSWTQ